MTSFPHRAPSGDDSDLLHLRRSFVRHLAADGRAPATRIAYVTAVAQLERFLADQRLPTMVADLQPDHLGAFFVELYERGMRPTTILARHHALARFFGWLVEENELTASPMAAIRAPAATLPHPRVLTRDEITALLAACDGDAFEDLRDAAMIRLFIDTGLRRTELAGLQLEDVDLDLNASYVAGAGRVPRAVPFDKATARALARYLAARAAHDWAHLAHLWLGRRRRLTNRGVDQVVRHRGQLAGLPDLRTNQFRHTFVQQFLADGGNRRDLMRLVGWKSRQLLARYRVSQIGTAPREADRPFSLVDRL